MDKTAQKGLFVWLCRVVLGAMLLLLGALSLLRGLPAVALTAALLVLAGLAFFGLYYLPAYFKRYVFSLGEDTLLLRTGVLVRKVTALPYQKMIMVTRVETPFAILFGVCAAVITLPGSRLWVPCLLRSDAERLSRLAGREDA